MVNFPKISEFKLTSSQKTAWIFGAGASTEKPYNVPMQGGLIDRFLKLKRPGGQVSQDNLKRLKDEIKEFCTRIQPGLQTEEAILEEVFTAYELESKSESSFPDEIEYANEAIIALRDAIIATIQIYGKGNAKKFNPIKRDNVHSPYAEFLEKIYPSGCSDDRVNAHSLVTMNYDLNLDRCIVNMLNPGQGEIYLDYGIDFADYRLPNSFTRPEARSALLLRLHGGLNWIRCQVCQSIFTTIDRHATVVKKNKCKMCKCEKLAYIIIHPSYIRKYDDPILQIIWGRFKEELIKSDRWVFVGYSLPTADVHLREVIRHSLRIRKKRNKTTDVIWVGYKTQDQDIEKAWNQQGRNYYSVFEKTVKAWDQSGGFGNFVLAMKES